MNKFETATAVEKWRAELSESEGISGDAIEELEGHLRESMTELESAGLSQEEAFLIASKRLGKCETLDREFSSVSSATVWKRRAFWMLLGFVDITAILMLVSTVGSIGIWAAMADGAEESLPIFSAVAYLVTVLLVIVAGVATWKMIFKGSPNIIAQTFGRAPILCSIGALLLLLLLKVGSSGLSLFTARTLSPEQVGTIALHGSIANVALTILSFLAICVGLAVLGKSLLPAKA